MKTGALALDALLTLGGQNAYRTEVLIALLIEKGVIDEFELDEREMEKSAGDEAVPCAEWARRCLNPEDVKALDAFFDTDPE